MSYPFIILTFKALALLVEKVEDFVLESLFVSRSESLGTKRIHGNVVRGVRVLRNDFISGSATRAPNSLVGREKSVDIDEAVNVAEEDTHRNENDILGIVSQMRDDLDNLGEANPGSKDTVGTSLSRGISVLDGAAQKQDKETVDQESRGLELRDVGGVQGPGVSLVPVRFLGHDNKVTAPVTASPAETLVDKAKSLFEGGLNGALFVKVERDVPAAGVDESSQGLVVVDCKLATKEGVITEVVVELLVLEDRSANSLGTPGKS